MNHANSPHIGGDQPVLKVSRTPTSLRWQVTDALRRAIVAGQFEPGQKLVERELCEMLGISRTLLREALQHLNAEGLIVNEPHRGPSIASITEQDAREIYEVRQNLEAMAGRGFALHATPEQVANLKNALAYLRTPEASSTPQKLLAAKNAFYAIMLEGCGNRTVRDILTRLNNRVTLLRARSLSQAGRLPQTLKEIAAIVKAIERRDADKAYEMCASHVAKAAAVALKTFSAGRTSGKAAQTKSATAV